MSLHATMDRIGTMVATVCSVHCALAPVLITLAPLLGLGFLFNESFETTLILMSFGLAFLSLIWGFYKKHRKFLPFFILMLGTVLISLSRFGFVADMMLPEPLLMGLGGLSIAISHRINLKLCKLCETCEHHAH